MTTNIPAGLSGIFTDYRQYKNRLDIEIKDNAEGFVRIGYLLKIARDTDILAESNYKTLAEFAQAEYGLTKDIVSRYIAVNDRYSQNGYSDQLADRYKGYGIAKLAEMLTLSDEIIAEIGPSLTRREIQEIKKEIAQEETITPVEIAIEAATPEAVKDEKEYSYTERIWKEFFHENRELYKELGKSPAFTAAFTEIRTEEIDKKAAKALMDILAPNGDAVLWSRVPGVGKIMISIHADDGTIVYTNTRTNEKTKSTSSDAESDIHEIFGECTLIDWGLVFYAPFEKPVEEKTKPESEKKKSEPEKLSVSPDKASESKRAAEVRKKFQDDIKAYKEKTGWDPNDPNWTQEKAKEYAKREKEAAEENPEVAPVQQIDEEVGMNPPEGAELREYNTRPLNSLSDVKNGDRLVNINTGETADVLGYCIGDIKAATDHGIILVSAPNSIGWMILEEESEDSMEVPDDDAKGQQDPEIDFGKMEKKIISAKQEFEDVFDMAYSDGFTTDGLLSMFKSVAVLKNSIDELLKCYLIRNGESEGDEDDGI